MATDFGEVVPFFEGLFMATWEAAPAPVQSARQAVADSDDPGRGAIIVDWDAAAPGHVSRHSTSCSRHPRGSRHRRILLDSD